MPGKPRGLALLTAALSLATLSCDLESVVILDPEVLGTVTGQVSASGLGPLEGINVRLAGVYADSTQTDDAGNYTFERVAGGQYTISISGLPSGVAFAMTQGAASVASSGQIVRLDFAGSAVPPLSVTTDSLPLARVDEAYSEFLMASGGGGGYAWSLANGSLPAGISLNPGTGELSGTPSATDTASFTVQVSTNADTASAALTLMVTDPSAALIHRWRFEETGGAGTTLVDDVGGAHGTIVDVGGRDAFVGGGVLRLTGGAPAASDYATLPSGLLNPLTDATIEVWGTQHGLEDWARIWEFGNSLSFLQAAWTVGTDANRSAVEWYDGTSLSQSFYAAPYIPDREYHVVVVIDDDGGVGDNTLMTWYVDGAEVGSFETAANLSGLSYADARVGSNNSLGFPVSNASYNEMRIYDGALTAAEVASNTSNPPPAPAGLTITTSALPGAQIGQPYSEYLTATGGFGTRQWTLAADTLPTGISLNGATGELSGTPTTVGMASFTVQVATPTDTASTVLSVAVTNPTATLIHRWRFEETGGAGTTLVDDVGGADGTIVNVGGSDAVVGGGVLTLTGGARAGSDYATLPAGLLTPLTDATIEVWGTQHGVQNWARIWDFGNGATHSLQASWSVGTDGNQSAVEWRDEALFSQAFRAMPYILDRQYHIVVVVDDDGGAGDNTLMTWYVDGTEVDSFETAANLSGLFDNLAYLGTSVGFGFDVASASYNEMRIYDGALSAAEIAANFGNPPP